MNVSMEDEECLPENSSLHMYLQKLGYSDVQLTKNFTSKTNNNISFVESKTKSKWLDAESLDEEVIEQIQIIVSTQMLFEEDIANIEKLLSSFKIVKNGLLKNMFQGFSGMIIFFFCLCLYWIIGSYAFVIVSSCYAYKAADYLWRKHYNQVRLKKLASVLQADFILLKKVIKFIEENNRIIESNYVNAKCISSPFRERFEFYENFKSDFFKLVNDMISVLCKSTQKLIKQMPLYDYVENPQYYLCNNFNKNCYEFNDLSKLYQIYLLIQSEFLQRLILSLIPNIKLTQRTNVQDLNKIITEVYIDLLKIKNKMNRKFKVIYLKGVDCAKSKIEFNVPAKTKATTNTYVEEFVSNIHDTSNTFQNLLIKSRMLEESMKNETVLEKIEDELVNMQNDLNSCQKSIENSFVLLKRANSVPEKCNVTQLKEEELEKCEEDLKKVFVGYTDLDPEIEDEIFEACFSDEKLDRDLSNLDDWDFEDKIRKKLEKEYSKKVIEELKIKLVDKAKSREKREALLLKKHYGISLEEATENEEVGDNKGEQVEDNVSDIHLNCDKENMLHLTEQFEEKSKNSVAHLLKNEYQNSNIKNEIYVPKKVIENETEVNTDNDRVQNCYERVNAQFLSDLKAARQIILNSDLAEEEFSCDPDEDFE